MTGFRKLFAGVAMALCVPAIIPQSALAQVKVMTSGGFAAPLREMLPEFEKSSGISVEVILGKSQGSDPQTISAQLGRGVAADIVILSREGLNDLVSANKIVPHSDVDLARTPLGLAVRAGAPEAGYQHGRSLQDCAPSCQVCDLSQQHNRHLYGDQAVSTVSALRMRSFRKVRMPASPPSPKAMPKSPFSR